jgi:hypothetical protein
VTVDFDATGFKSLAPSQRHKYPEEDQSRSSKGTKMSDTLDQAITSAEADVAAVAPVVEAVAPIVEAVDPAAIPAITAAEAVVAAAPAATSGFASLLTAIEALVAHIRAGL